jgi:cysteinyl-tRNA synthetase
MATPILSEPEHEYLYITRKRLMDLPPERIIDVQTPPASALTNVRSALQGERELVREAVLGFLKAVNELCDRALRRNGQVNLSAVQAAEESFALLRDQLALGIEAPEIYLRRLRDARAAARQLDVAAVETAIRERAAARSARDFTTADRLQRELLARGVMLVDNAQGSDWTLAAPSSSDSED